MVILGIILFILLLCALVIVHEFGHFIVAKICGVRVNEFSVGMGPKLCGVKKGDTEYSIRLFPIGGFCAMEDEDGLKADAAGQPEKGSFYSMSVWRRIAIVVAGPVFNLLFAYMLYMVYTVNSGSNIPIVNNVVENSPLESIGVVSGDKIISLNHERVYTTSEVTIFMTLHDGEDVEVCWEHDGERHSGTLQPYWSDEYGKWMMGCTIGELESPGHLSVFRHAFYEFHSSVFNVIKSLRLLLTGKIGGEAISGPIGMAKVVSEVTEEAQQYSWMVTAFVMISLGALLSANLGIMNLLPIPALDGGRLLIYLVEAVIRKRPTAKQEAAINGAGFAFLMCLMVLIAGNDIMNIVKGAL